MAMPRKTNNRQLTSKIHNLQRSVLPRCYRLPERVNPPMTLNSGDVWHDRSVVATSLASVDGSATLTGGQILSALSGNSSNVPIRIKSIRCWAIAGTAGTYPPTFLQVNFNNEEFCQSFAATASIRDSLLDAGGQGSGPPNIGLGVPTSLGLARSDWTTSTTTVIATAASLPSGARCLWRVELCFKF